MCFGIVVFSKCAKGIWEIHLSVLNIHFTGQLMFSTLRVTWIDVTGKLIRAGRSISTALLRKFEDVYSSHVVYIDLYHFLYNCTSNRGLDDIPARPKTRTSYDKN